MWYGIHHTECCTDTYRQADEAQISSTLVETTHSKSTRENDTDKLHAHRQSMKLNDLVKETTTWQNIAMYITD